MAFRILIQSQDAQLFLFLQHVLATEGFAASLTCGAEETLAETREDDVRAIIVDCSAPGAVLQHLKAARPGVEVVLLLRQASETAVALVKQADPGLVLDQPFNPARLIQFLRRLRLDALIEKGGARASQYVLRFGDLEMNTASVKVRRSGHDIPLTALQFRLLRHLMQNPDSVQSREQLIAAGWPPEADVDPRTVDIHMGHIRRALKMLGPDLIRTVRTVGYALDTAPHLEET